MECDDVSGSSLSSSEWEDLGSDLSHGDNDGREVVIFIITQFNKD